METVMTVIVSMCLVIFMMILTQVLRCWVHKRRHLFRKKIRERYVIKDPKQFLNWSDKLSMVEIKYFSDVLDGYEAVKVQGLENVLSPR